MTPNEIVAANMRRLRRARGWTQSDLAEIWGVPAAVVINSEGRGGSRKPRMIGINDVVALAGVFGVSVDDLITAGAVCLTCAGAPPRGFTCQTCGTAGEPAAGAA